MSSPPIKRVGSGRIYFTSRIFQYFLSLMKFISHFNILKSVFQTFFLSFCQFKQGPQMIALESVYPLPRAPGSFTEDGWSFVVVLRERNIRSLCVRLSSGPNETPKGAH